MSTVFTKIIEGEFPGLFAWADDVVVAFATIEPISPGHMLVVPRDPVDQFSDLDDDVLGHAALVTGRIGRAQRKAFDAPRAALMIAGFEVPHAHMHVLPAWDQAAITLERAKKAEQPELRSNTERVREALREMGWGAFVPESINSPHLA
ncbi:MAG TPA: HIT family protein [Actinomycetaceae bacterium]|nr:HIT family protein [Actinomycetaceae bacterium]